jgi:SAM-dependent methyltransferase
MPIRGRRAPPSIDEGLRAMLVKFLSALKRLLRRAGLFPATRWMLSRCVRSSSGFSYRIRSLIERASYADVDGDTIHALPPILRYWEEEHLLPKFRSLGFAGVNDVLLTALSRAYDAGTEPRRFVSVGAGNCQLEIDLAASLVASGRSDFVYECLELNPIMLERAASDATAKGVREQISLCRVDVNRWSPAERYECITANQSLHHVVNLEGLFDAVYRSLLPSGTFAVSDIIGRNGHMRWPEALDLVEEIWPTLPDRLKFNHVENSLEGTFHNIDHSAGSFEGIRAQDILPLMLERFTDYDLFLAFGNLIDPFIDRTFGPNFDVRSEYDRSLIDSIALRDEAAIEAGTITPTHLVAVFAKDRPGLGGCWNGLTPERALRQPTAQRPTPNA